MICVSCHSYKQAELTAEMLVHFPGLKNLEVPGVWLFPELMVCLDCGFSWFIVPETALPSIASGTLAIDPAMLEGSVAGGGNLDNQIAFRWQGELADCP
jgi:hypothetical protein